MLPTDVTVFSIFILEIFFLEEKYTINISYYGHNEYMC